ncbi:MAG TPA: protein kinase [Feifaniaceae bacterium]|nr:protein kinase [Feifaniaceae bacterium]
MEHTDIRLCPNCMRESAPGVCPRCGFDGARYDAPPHQLRPGAILGGKYLVGRSLGEGGFGITYIGFDLNLELRVAVKEYYPNGFVTRQASVSRSVTPLTGAQGEQYGKGLNRFVQEAKSLARFHDLDGIVSVKDFFRENGTAYIIMEYIEGETLKRHLANKGGKLPMEETLSLLRPVMESLALVHGAGVIHRDISPDNIMLTRRGAKLIDFGAARTYVDEENRSRTVTLKSGYAPYEQYQTRGEQGPYTDVYALCATIYRCVTGRVPPESIERLDADTLLPPSALHAALTPLEEAVLLKGLSVRARDRYQDIPQVFAALQGEAGAGPEPQPVPAPAPEGKKRKAAPRIRFLAGGGALALAAALILLPSINPKEAAAPAVTADIPGLSPKISPKASPAISVATAAPEIAAATPAPTEPPALTAAELAQINRFAAACGNRHVVFLQPGGSVGSVGSDLYGQRGLYEGADIVQLAAGYAHTVALRADGSVAATRILEPAGAEPYEYGQCGVGSWRNVVQVEAGWVHSVGLLSDGTVAAAGDNAHGQCDVQGWSDVVEIAAGGWNTAALTADGRVLVAGDNKYKQCDVSWEDEGIVHIAVGREFVVGLRADGTVIAAGRNLQNQCEVSSWRDIVAVATGDYHAIGLRADGTVATTSFTGTNAHGQDQTGGWQNIVAVYGGARTTVGMQGDGTLLVAGLVDADSYTKTGALPEKAAVSG